MKSAMNDRRLLADVFHDVDLAAGGPTGGSYVIAQASKMRARDPCPNGILIRASKRPKAWVNLFLVSNLAEVNSEFGRRPSESFLKRFNNQESAFLIRVCSPTGIGLKVRCYPNHIVGAACSSIK